MAFLKSAALILLAAAGNAAAQDEKLTVMFVNQFADTAIELYWENHAFAADHPERRRLEARIEPRGGWHSSETFLGHGEIILLCCCESVCVAAVHPDG